MPARISTHQYERPVKNTRLVIQNPFNPREGRAPRVLFSFDGFGLSFENRTRGARPPKRSGHKRLKANADSPRTFRELDRLSNHKSEATHSAAAAQSTTSEGAESNEPAIDARAPGLENDVLVDLVNIHRAARKIMISLENKGPRVGIKTEARRAFGVVGIGPPRKPVGHHPPPSRSAKWHG